MENFSINKFGDKDKDNDITIIKNNKNISNGNLIMSEDNFIIILINGNCFNIFSLEKK